MYVFMQLCYLQYVKLNGTYEESVAYFAGQASRQEMKMNKYKEHRHVSVCVFAVRLLTAFTHTHTCLRLRVSVCMELCTCTRSSVVKSKGKVVHFKDCILVQNKGILGAVARYKATCIRVSVCVCHFHCSKFYFAYYILFLSFCDSY